MTSTSEKECCIKRAASLRERGQVLVLVIIVLALIGGGYWYLISSRRDAEKQAWTFAREVAERIALQQDARFINLNLSPKAQVAMPPSARDLLIVNLRNLGTPDRNIGLTGKVEFASYFFDPKGAFRAQLNYPSAPAYLDIAISASNGPWCIDSLNLVSSPPRE